MRRMLIGFVLLAGCESKPSAPTEKPGEKPADKSSAAPSAASEPIAPEKLCAIYVGLADAETKLDDTAKATKTKRCVSRAEGMKASDETGYKCLVDCTQKAKNYADARACQKNCRGGKKGGPSGDGIGSASPKPGGFGGRKARPTTTCSERGNRRSVPSHGALSMWIVVVALSACGRRDPRDEPPAPAPSPVPSIAPGGTSATVMEIKDAPPAIDPIDAELAALVGTDAGAPRAVALLKSLGFVGKELEGNNRTIKVASRSANNLDADADFESVVQVSATSSSGSTTQMLELYLAWLDPKNGKSEVIGHRRLVLKTCTYEPTYTLTTQHVHATTFDDTVVEWEAITACDGHLGATGAIVSTLERGKPEAILEIEDSFEFGQGSGKVFDAKGFVRFEGTSATLVEDGKVKKELVFDPTTFRYR